MLRQSSSRNHRSRKLRPRHSFQALLLVAVGIWIVYQLARSHSKRQAAVVAEADDADMDDGEPARSRLGRKGGFAGRISDDDVSGVSSDDVGLGVSPEDPLSTAEGGDEEDQGAGEDDGDADDGLAEAEDEDDADFQSQNGSREGELKTAQGETPNGLEISNVPVPPVNATGVVQDGAAVLLQNATASVTDGAALNTSSHDRGTTGDVENQKPANNG